MLAPVEFTSRYAALVEDLSSAWSFVMSHIDSVGPSPSIHIKPYWTISEDINDSSHAFEVFVEGTIILQEDNDQL